MLTPHTFRSCATSLGRLAFTALATCTVAAAANAQVTQVVVDFGQSPGVDNGCDSPLFTGTFDGSSGFLAMNISDCGVVESPSLDVGGGVTLQFFNVSGWNNTDGRPPTDSRSLTGDHFLTADLGADEVASFSLSGVAESDLVLLELLDRRGGEAALVTFEGVETLVDAVGGYETDDEIPGGFTNVSGSGVTGKTSYSGTFTGPNGNGQGNLVGARITIIKSGDCIGDFNGDLVVDGSDLGQILGSFGSDAGGDLNGDGLTNGADVGIFLGNWGDCPGGGPTGSCCFGIDCIDGLTEADCNSIANAEYNGDGSACDEDTCVPPGPGLCCEANANGIASCIDLRCAYAVCLSLPECCDTAWDQSCADQAASACNDSCDAPRDITVAAIDFGQAGGCSSNPVYSGAFDGIDGFVGLTISDCCAVESPSIDIGNGVTLQFFNVSGWNNTDGRPDSDTRTLTGDHFLSNGCDADEFVQFEVRGMNPSDTLILEFTDRRGGERARVTFEGNVVGIDSISEYENDPPPAGFGFTDVSNGGVTGKAVYEGEFTGFDGNGEGNLSGARITVIPGSTGRYVQDQKHTVQQRTKLRRR